MTRDDIRSTLLEALKKLTKENFDRTRIRFTQMTSLVDSVRSLIPQDAHPNQHVEYHKIVFEIVNEWHLAGMIYFGKPDDPNTGHPWVTLTEFGQECLDTGNFLPYDPEGYVHELQKQVPAIDPLTVTYLRESITAYNRELLLSATITLGVASENIILLLIESFTNALSNQTAHVAFIKATTDRSIYAKYSLFITELKKYSKQLPSALTKDFEPQLDGVFNFIRITRNQAGHPTGQAPNKKVIGSNLQIFAEYSKKVFELIGYFNSNKI